MVRVRWLVASAVVLAGACKGEDKPEPEPAQAQAQAPPPVAAPPPKLELVGCVAAPPQRQGAEVDLSSLGIGGLGSGASWGRYGTIGHGAGTGHHGPLPPTIALGQPVPQGSLDKAVIRRYVRRNLQKLQYCYEKELLINPNLEGTVSAQFFIKPDGKVATATASGIDDKVAKCVAEVLRTIEFPKPTGGGGVQVNYPFTFRPAGSTASTPSPAPASGQQQYGMIGLLAPTVVHQWTPTARETPATKGDVTPRGSAEVGDAIRGKLGELEACFATANEPGRIRVMLALDPHGAPPEARVGGFGNAAVERCVADVLRAIHVPAPVNPTELACDLVRGGDDTWRATIDGGYTVIGATKAGVVVGGLPLPADQAAQKPVPGDRAALVVLESDTSGDVLAQALRVAAHASQALVAVHGTNVVIAGEGLDQMAHAFELRDDHGTIHACAVDAPADVSVPLADRAKLNDVITKGRVCSPSPCPVVLVADAGLSASDLLAIAAVARKANVELVGIVSRASCSP